MADHGPNYQGNTAYNFSAATGEAHMSGAGLASMSLHEQGGITNMHCAMCVSLVAPTVHMYAYTQLIPLILIRRSINLLPGRIKQPCARVC
jgi:hypothetical protein